MLLISFQSGKKKNVRRFKLQSSISIYVLCSVLYNSFKSNFYEFEEEHTMKEPTFFFLHFYTCTYELVTHKKL